MDGNVKKAISDMKEKYGIILTKESFKSFNLLKPHIDMLINKIVMGSPVLSATNEAIALYATSNSDSKQVEDFRKTFEMDEDGCDDIVAVKLIRYSRFLQYLTNMLGWKYSFEIVDLIETNPSRMSSLILLFIDFATLSATVSDGFKEAMTSVAKEKTEQIEYLEQYAQKEKDLIKDSGLNYDSFLGLEDKYLEEYDSELTRHTALSANLDKLKAQIEGEERQEEILKHNLEQEWLITKTINEEVDSLKRKTFDSPERLAAVLADTTKEIDIEKAKLNQYFISCSQLKSQCENVEIMESFQQAFYENVAAVMEQAEKLRSIEKEIASLNFSKAVQLEPLRLEKETIMGNIKDIMTKIDNYRLIIERNEEDLSQLNIQQVHANELIVDEEMKISNLEQCNGDVDKQIMETKEQRAKLGREYSIGLETLENNFVNGVKELLEHYKKL